MSEDLVRKYYVHTYEIKKRITFLLINYNLS